jgi:hypothetical protein
MDRVWIDPALEAVYDKMIQDAKSYREDFSRRLRHVRENGLDPRQYLGVEPGTVFARAVDFYFENTLPDISRRSFILIPAQP